MERDAQYARAFDLAARLRGYKAASHDKNATPWLNASDRSADGELLQDLPTLRNRTRAANRDDALACGITNTFVRGVVGTGLRPQARTGDDAKDDALEAVWASRANHLAPGEGGLSHGLLQRLVYGKRIEDGEVFRRAAVAAPGEPLWIENVEAERVCTPADATPADPQGRIVDGIEKDRHSRVVAYWILRHHPGDTGARTKVGSLAERVSPFGRASFDRVEAWSVCHDRAQITRPGQTRGVPRAHAILQDLRDLDLLMLARIKKEQVGACLSAFLTSAADSSDLISLTATDYGYQLDEKLTPGMLFRLYPGEEVQFLNPNTGNADFEVLSLIIARRIGAAIGLSPQAVLRMWEGVNYSGARTIKIDDRQTFRAERSDFASQSLSWEWRLVLEDELLRGNPRLLAAGVTVEDLVHVEWIGDEEQWVDPQAEADAIEAMLRLGLTTPQIEAARLGRDWQELVRQKLVAEKFERDLRAELGLPTLEEVAAAKPGAQPRRPAIEQMPAPRKAAKEAA